MLRLPCAFVLSLGLAAAFTDSASAGIIGGSEILSSSDASFLSDALGAGPTDLTRVFSSSFGDDLNGSNFYASVDGLGDTFTVLRVKVGDHTFVIGGYNPASWDGALCSYTF